MSTGKALVMVLLALAGASCSQGGSPGPATPSTGGSSGATPGGSAGQGGAGAGAPAPGGGQGGVASSPAADAGPAGGGGGTGGPAVPDSGTPGSDTAAPTPLGPFPIDQVVNAKPELYAAMGGHIEGPSWREGEIFFSVVSQALFRIDVDRKITRYVTMPSNGSFLLADGSLLVCDERRSMVQVFRDGKAAILGSGGICNDVTVDAWGNIYFSDFGSSVSMITPEGVQTKVLPGLRSPNGVEVDPESKYLYIMPRPSDIFRVAINKDGPMGQPEKIFTLPGGVTDGCAFDAWGNLWVSAYYAGKASIYDPVKGQVLGTVNAGGGGLTNLTFGGPNHDTLFATVDNKGIFRIPVGVAGFRGHPGAPKYANKGYLTGAP
jgi:gluconolactonase